MRRLILILLVAAAAYYAYTVQVRPSAPVTNPAAAEAIPSADAFEVVSTESSEILRRAFANQQTNLQVRIAGVVQKILSDDTDGSAHQRFVLQLASGQTVLIAHNIDLASRIPALAVGDRVMALGEYEWNRQGGVVHWTHRDPSEHHVAGWIKHHGKTYQ